MNFGEKIKQLRIEKGWNQDFVAQKLQISVPALSRYESGTYEPKSMSIISDFAKLFDVSVDYLFGLNLAFNPTNNSIPLLGVVKAGYDLLAEENLLGFVEADIKNPEEYFALRVKGDSMQPILFEDDIVIVHQQPDIESGEVSVVLIDNEATIKKVVKHDDCIELVAFNSYYPPKRLEQGFKIIGKVVEARIKKIFE